MCHWRGYDNKWAGVKSLAAITAVALLGACQSGEHEAKYSNYLTRLGRTLGVEAPDIMAAALPRLPRPGRLQLPLAAGNLGALDFLAISGCAVQVTIGKRNSSLGRMARPSQRLLLELEYLRLAPECIAYQRSQDRGELADTLQQAWEMKRRQLPARVFNATLGSAEYRSLWDIPAAPGPYPEGTGSQVINALQAIDGHARRWLDGDYRADNRDFELLLSEVAAGDAGALLQALARQGDWLRAANAVVSRHRAKGPLCAPGRRPAAADILPNVIRKYFVGDIQPRAAALGRRYHQLLPPVNQLESLLDPVLPAAYRDWQQRRDAALAELAAAPRRHVEHLIAIQHETDVRTYQTPACGASTVKTTAGTTPFLPRSRRKQAL